MSPVYVQFGCGFSVGKDWINFDSSPTLRIERVPVLGRFFGRLAGNSQPFPQAVRYGDICEGLPIADDTASGVYASHVLEHLSYSDLRRALANTFRMLKPGGEFRLIVPDLEERVRQYIAALAENDPEACSRLMRSTMLGQERRPSTWLARLRQLVGGSAHLWMWDEKGMFKQLEEAGFVDLRRCVMGDSGDPYFDQVEDRGRFVDKGGFNELAISAHKAVP